MSGSRLALTFACLLVIVGGVLYLEWLHAGELELLESRVDELEHARRQRASSSSSRAKRKSATTKGGGDGARAGAS